MRDSLEKFLQESGHFNAVQIGDAQRTRQFFGGSLLSNMVRLGYLTERTAGDYFAEWSGYPYIAYRELKNRSVPAGVRALITAEVAARRQVVPFLLEDGKLHVVTCRDSNAIFFGELERQHGVEVIPHITPDERLEALLEQHYGIVVKNKQGMRSVAIRMGDDFTAPAPEPEPVEELSTDLPSDIGLDGLPLDSDVPVSQFTGGRADYPFSDAEIADDSTPSPPADTASPRASWEGPFSLRDGPPTGSAGTSSPAGPPHSAPGGEASPPSEDPPLPHEPLTTEASVSPPSPASYTDETPLPDNHATSTGGAAPANVTSDSRLRRMADTPLIVLSRARDRESLGEATIELVLQLGARRVAVLGHQEERLVGWSAGGAGIDQTRFKRLSLPLYAPSIFSTLGVNPAPFVGIVPDQPANQELVAALGGVAPKIAAAVPVMLRGRMVAVIYADGGPDATNVLELKPFQDAASKLSMSLEILLLRKKIARG